MTGDAEKFLSLTEVDGGTITFGEKRQRKNHQQGQHQAWRTNHGKCSVRHNLFNISQFCDKIYEISLKNDECNGNFKDPSQAFLR